MVKKKLGAQTVAGKLGRVISSTSEIIAIKKQLGT
jgi:hypothetical protein